MVGAGYWGPNLVRNFHASHDWTVRCVVERDRERSSVWCASTLPMAGLADIDDALQDPSVDAIALGDAAANPPRVSDAGDRRGQTRARREAASRAFRDAADLCERAAAAGVR